MVTAFCVLVVDGNGHFWGDFDFEAARPGEGGAGGEVTDGDVCVLTWEGELVSAVKEICELAGVGSEGVP